MTTDASGSRARSRSSATSRSRSSARSSTRSTTRSTRTSATATAATSSAMIEMHRRLAVLGRVLLLASRYKPAWIAGTTANSAGEDPREHGDRPQRPARPVGLDERPADPLLDLGLGHRLDRGGLEALPQLRPPHLHEHPRQGQGPRLRDHADRPAPEVAPGLPAPAVLQRAADGCSSSGASPSTTSTSRRSARARSRRSRCSRS